MPPSGSDLELWIDSNPDNNLRILRYEIECALPSGTAVQMSYRGIDYGPWYGVANLGPSLAEGLMTDDDQEKVSSCLLARVNASGQHVIVDMMGPMAGFDSSDPETASYYSRLEALQWGNLFTSPPSMGMAGPPCGTRACAVSASLCIFNRAYDQFCGPINVYDWLADPELGSLEWITKRLSLTAPYYALYVVEEPGGRMWNHPITTYIHPQASGESCTIGLECSSSACNPATGTCD
jgi:hypothetical protein